MSALAYKRSLEQIAGLSQDTAGMSGADLQQAAMAAQANVPPGTTIPGGARLGQMEYRGAKDDFTGGNAALGGRFPKNTPNRVWVVDNTGFTIAANALVYDGVADRHAVIDTGMLDNFAVRAKQTALTANGMRLILRADGVTTANVYVFRDQTANVWKLINDTGTATISQFADATDLVANDVVECQVRGDNVSVLVNGVVRGVLTGMAGVYPAGSRQGFLGSVGSGFTADDFFAYPIA